VAAPSASRQQTPQSPRRGRHTVEPVVLIVDSDDAETRECRLCGGVKAGPLDQLAQVGFSAEKAAAAMAQLSAVIATKVDPSNFGPSCYERELGRERYRKGLGL